MPRRMLEGTVLADEAGSPRYFPPGTLESDLPAWAVKLITAPSIWGDQPPDGPDRKSVV